MKRKTSIVIRIEINLFRSRHLPSCVFVLSLLYMKRLRTRPLRSSLTEIDQLTTKELYLIATLLANKYLIDEGEDEQLFNSELAELTGLTTKRINYIERQVLVAFDWDLYVSTEEFQEFFSIFKKHLTRKFPQQIEMEDATKFYHLCFQNLPQIFEYVTLTSLVLLGSTISILTAVHLGLFTQSILMKTIHPDITCLPTSTCSWNSHLHEKVNRSLDESNQFFHFDQPAATESWNFFANETKNDQPKCTNNIFDLSSCSINLLQTHTLSRSLVQTFG